MPAAVLAASAAAAAAVGGSTARHDAGRAREAARLNALPGMTWAAGRVARFAGTPAGSSRPLLGVKPRSAAALNASVRRGEVKLRRPRDNVTVPSSFDAAARWPQCARVINDIRDQSNCGCCWAFAGASAASDRLCIATNGTVAVPLSAQATCFCASDDGCGGGYVTVPWAYIKSHGLVTGGQNAATGDGATDPFRGAGLCSAFSLPHCHHYGPPGVDPYPGEGAEGCPLQASGSCPTVCDSAAEAPHDAFDEDKWSFTGDIEAYQGEAAMQQAVMQHGPIEVAYTVFSDFESYTGGVYQHVSGEQMGVHAVKLVGWGADGGVKYWKLANSWNPYWGENGNFRIKRGSNECGIEDQGTANDGSGSWTQGTPTNDACQETLDEICGSKKGTGDCLPCALSHNADLQAKGCSADDLTAYCGA